MGLQGWDLGLKAGNQASRLGFGPQGWDLDLKAGIVAPRLGSGLQGTKGEKRMRIVRIREFEIYRKIQGN